MKAFLGMLAAALGAAALLVVCGACDGDVGASESQRSAEAAVEDDCPVCLLFDLDPQVDDE